jgi:DNA-binding winged helix-turn-helix (wHTH) protein/tetratricopeptide (TPR) repeat protein
MFRIGAWFFDPTTRRLLCGREERKLSPKGANVLLALAETPAQVWSRDALLERSWPNVTVGEEVLTHAIAELRRAFGDDVRAPTYVQTVYKSGYRLVARVERAPLGARVDATQDGFRNLGSDEGGADFDLDVYAEYLRASELYDRGGRKNMSAAVALFTSILEKAPHFALAHAALAKALTFLGVYYERRKRSLETALIHSTAARKIDSRSAEAFAAEGMIFSVGGDFARSSRSFATALRLNPNSAETHYLLGRACLVAGELSLASVMLERAASLRADDYHAAVIAGKVRQGLGDARRARADYALALPRAEARLAINPRDYRALCTKARCLWELGTPDEAVALMEQVAGHPDPMNYHLACTFARAGESGRALDVLEEVVDLGWRHGAWLSRDPDLDALRGTGRFKRICRAVGAEA